MRGNKSRTTSERRWIWILAALAAIRVFVFAAAFPFFNNVDEQAHVDLVLKYSHGQSPRGMEPISAESAYYFGLYGSPEYLGKPEQFRGGEFPQPLWQEPSEVRDEQVRRSIAEWESYPNFEAGEPPLYYVVTGLFWKLGSFFGLHGAYRLYALRFLNAGVLAALIWIGYGAARLVFPERSFPRLAVPVLVAFFPQDSFYSIQNDVLSPLFFGIAFVGLLRWFLADQPRVAAAVYTGLALSAACLVKTTNLPLLIPAALAAIFRAGQLIRARAFRRNGLSFVALAFCTVVPFAGWIAWNYHTFGEATATAGKIQILGWTQKPISQWWPHPIFTLRGLHYFWSELLASFWRGEFVWHWQRLASGAADGFYWISSTLALALVIIALCSRRGMPKLERTALSLGLGSFFAVVIFLIGLSLAFDFGNCISPSRDFPYFTSGRYLGGALIPFLLLFAYALEQITSWTKKKWLPFLLLGIIVAGITTSEILINRPAFASRYNFFHLGSEAKSDPPL
jgi:hypothetical protein